MLGSVRRGEDPFRRFRADSELARLILPRKHERHAQRLYFDDLKAAGPQKELDAMWKELSMHIQIEPPTNLGRHLGCEHSVTEEYIDASKVPWANLPGMRGESSVPGRPDVKKVKVMNYDVCPIRGAIPRSLRNARGEYYSLPTVFYTICL